MWTRFVILVLSVLSLIIAGDTANQVLSHFNFDMYPDIESVLEVDSAQPKQTAQSSTTRYSLLNPDLICTVAKGRILKVKLLVPSGSTGSEFQLQIWRRLADDTFNLTATIAQVFSTSGTFVMEDGIDFSGKYMEFNDIIGLWLPWKYPVAAINSNAREAYGIAKNFASGSNTLDQKPPVIGSVEALSFVGVTNYELALEIELEDQKHSEVAVHEELLLNGHRYRRGITTGSELGGPVTMMYTSGAKGEKGEIGATGSTGAVGTPGQNGAKGLQGSKGFKGSKGVRGDVGEDGIYTAGDPGIQGLIGSTGSTGSTGEAGAAGATGVKGLSGTKGSEGQQGGTGSRGQPGDKGVIGISGSRGPQGPKGVLGDTGNRGDKGRQGETGERGERGPSNQPLQDIIATIPDKCTSNSSCINAHCIDTLVGPQCLCWTGFRYKPNNVFHCEDEDECLLGLCSHQCTNTEGSFYCSCRQGYTLASNNRSCILSESSEACYTCTDEGYCLNMGLSVTCIPIGYSIEGSSSSSSNALALEASKQTDISEETMLSEEWIIVFLVWGIVLTIITLVLAVWLIYESRISMSSKENSSRAYNQMNGTLLPPNALYLDLNSHNANTLPVRNNKYSDKKSQQNFNNDIYD